MIRVYYIICLINLKNTKYAADYGTNIVIFSKLNKTLENKGNRLKSSSKLN